MSVTLVLYIIGLCLAVFYIIMGFDDFVWDILSLFKRHAYIEQRFDLQKLRSVQPKLLAMTVAAWHESNVLGDVIENMIASCNYPSSMYHIFLGVYPNDPETIAVADDLAKRHENVHIVINDQPGPTSKAQNINYVIREIRNFEAKKGWQFASLTIHDSEDVIHPYELLATNYLIDYHDALQFPVFPIIRIPTFSNFFRTITTGTYADEFAENHYMTMVGRYSMGAFVPSAGTGFVLTHHIIDQYGDEDILPTTSLTEDYRLSLTLFEQGIRMYYVLERVPRVDDRGNLRWDYITTRSLFPSTFRSAIKQKTRWIFGITMQSFYLRDVLGNSKLSLAGRYSLYKDVKAKIGNLLVFVGYPVFIYFIISLFIPLIPIYPKGTLSWYLCFIVTLMMIERQLFRAISVYHIYGMRSVFFACLLPPLFPIRVVWGNIINMVATIKAFKQATTYHQPLDQDSEKQKKELAEKNHSMSAQNAQKITWVKTHHDFLNEQTLKRYRRTLGDTLLKEGLITPQKLSRCLRQAKQEGLMLGRYLKREGILSDEQLARALAEVWNIPYVAIEELDCYNVRQLASDFNPLILKALSAIPLFSTSDNGYVVGFNEDDPRASVEKLSKVCQAPIHPVVVSNSFIEKALQQMSEQVSPSPKPNSFADRLYTEGLLSYEQVVLLHSGCVKSNKSEKEMLIYMGLCDSERDLEAISS